MADEADTLDKTDTTADDAADKAKGTDAGDDADKGTETNADADKGTDDDWRTRLAGEDTKLAAWLGRYPSEADAIKDAKKRFDTLREGGLIKPLGDDPSEAEVKAWREAMGVPEKPEGYLEKLSGGLVVGDDDRPVVDQFLGAMHEKHVPAAITDAVLQTYYKIVEAQDAKISEAVDAARVKCEDELREDYGADYRRNMNAAEAHIGTLPAELQEAINNGFDGKGIPLRSNSAVSKWLVSLALEANPLATVVPGTGARQASAIAEEIAEIETLMRTNRDAYNRDTAKQARLRELYAARDKLAGADKAGEQG